jgi:hypothetical protein
MEPTAEQVAAAVAVEASRELTAATKKIKHCLGQLSDEQAAPVFRSSARVCRS